jgi:N-methylhydantoinase A
VLFQDGDWHDAAVVPFEAMTEGDAVDGPAIVESAFTTLVVDPGTRVHRTASGSLLIAPHEVVG